MRRNTYFSRSLVEALLSADTRTGERRTESGSAEQARPLELPRARSCWLTKALLILSLSAQCKGIDHTIHWRLHSKQPAVACS